MNLITIDEKFITSGQSKYGGWSKEQFALIGVNWPPKRGWKKEIIGKQIPENKMMSFLLLRNSHIKSKNKTPSLFQCEDQL